MQDQERNEKNVEVFKTNITNFEEAQLISESLRNHFPEWKINIDLHDCDKILRIEGLHIVPIGGREAGAKFRLCMQCAYINH